MNMKRKKFSGYIIFTLAILTGGFGCAHTFTPVTHEIPAGQNGVTDASDNPQMKFWRDLQIEYYRDGEMIYLEWGKIFADPDNSGRILVYSPEDNRFSTRAYEFSKAVLDPEDPDEMECLLAPVVLRGWRYAEAAPSGSDTLVAKAFPNTGSEDDLYSEPDYDKLGFFLWMFAEFLEIWVDIITH
jgi:hypothetical protein